MPSAPADAAELLLRLRDDQIENFWITYNDYSGVQSAKTIPPSGFKSGVNDGAGFRDRESRYGHSRSSAADDNLAR